MLLTIDVANNIGFGLFEGDKLVHQFRCESARQRTGRRVCRFRRQMRPMKAVDHGRFGRHHRERLPSLTERDGSTWSAAAFAREPLVSAEDPLRYGHPHRKPQESEPTASSTPSPLIEQVKGGVIVVDFGTPPRSMREQKGEYLAGVIAPGIQISAMRSSRARQAFTACEMPSPPAWSGEIPFNRCSRIVFGYAGLVDAWVRRNQVGARLSVR